MTVFVVAHIKVLNKDKYQAYREKAAEALAKHGGAVVKVGPVEDVLEGAGFHIDAIVIIQFPDKEAAFAWKNDPELAEIHALRTSGADTNIVLLG